MSDNFIGLPFDEEYDDDRAPNRRRGKGRHRDHGKAERRRTRTVLISSIIVLAVLAGGLLYGGNRVFRYFFPPDYDGQGTSSVVVVIGQGTLTDIGETLYKKDVVKSAKAFAKAANENTEGNSISPGTYKLRKQMKASLVVQLMLDPSSRVQTRFTIPEGFTVRQVYKRISENSSLKVGDLEAAAKDPVAIGLPTWAKGDLEGFLYPETYQVEPGDTATKVLKRMVAGTVDQMTAMQFATKARALHLDPLDALKVASLLQGEGIPADHPKISRVVYNRLAQKMPLQFDSTTIYGRELRGVDRQTKLTQGELKNASDPYSTYKRMGLPPTPIGNPGKEALASAIAPVPGNWLYFVKIDKQGNSAFAATLPEHNANVDRAKKNGALP